MRVIHILTFLIIGVGLLVVTYQNFIEFLVWRRLKKTGLKVKGTIKEFEKEVGDTSDTYFPIVQFFTYSSEEIIGKPLDGYSEREYLYYPREVEIIYLESNPEVFIIKGQEFSYIAFLIFIGAVIGILFFIIKVIEQTP